MRKISILAIVCALVLAFAAGSAYAFRSYTTQTGKSCGYCHVDPDGGGPLTAAGEYFNDNGTLPPATPTAPSGLTATAASSSQINLKWTDNSSDETGFKVERSSSATGTFTAIATLAAGVTTYNNTSLAASTAYYYRVCATNASGNSGYSNTASATTSAPPPVPPTAPTGLSATAASASQINLKWTDASSNETGFKVERSSSATGTFTAIATLAAGVTTYSNTGLTASTTYYYRVCATGAAGNSGYSNTASAATSAPPPVPPTAPTGLSATAASSSQINLKWTDTSSNETGFIVERASTSAGPFTAVATLAAGVTTYNNTGLTASTTYYYRVCATGAAGNSGYSNTASAATQAPPPVPPAAPTGLSATAASSSQINLRWTDASSNETGFIVERSSSSAGTYTAIATLAAGVTTYNNTGLTASTTYYYRVCATGAAGNSGYSNTASAATQAPTPVTPTTPNGLSATAASTSQIDLKWTDTSSNETGFKVERSSTATGTFTAIATLAAGVTTYSNTGLTASTTYYYRVCATGAAGNSGYSNMASAATSAPTPEPPAAPTGLSATAASSSQINLKWTDASSNETGFIVERSTSATDGFAEIAKLAAGVISYNNTGLTASTTYYYRVCSHNGDEYSYSETVSAATLATPPPSGLPTAPASLIAKAISSRQIVLKWSDTSSNETGFIVERASRSTGRFTKIATLAAGVTTYSNTGLRSSTTYYYRVCAYNADGNSGYSNTASAKTLKRHSRERNDADRDWDRRDRDHDDDDRDRDRRDRDDDHDDDDDDEEDDD